MIVENRTARFDEPLALECGRTLPRFEVAYETYGELAEDRANAILVCHAYTSDHHAAGRHAEDDARAGWWDDLIGPGKVFDTKRWFVVSSNCLGGSHGTTGPGAIDPETGRRYAGGFPVVTMADIVNVQARLADRLGIARFHAVVGGCFGGAQVLEWMASHPGRLANAMVISATARASVHTVALSLIAREAVRRDPRWNGGDYYDGEPPSGGIGLLTMFGALFWQDRNLLQRKLAPDMARPRRLAYGFEPEFEIERQLLRLGTPQHVVLDANALLYLARANDYFDLSRRRESLAAALCGFRGRALLLGFAEDWRYPVAEIAEIDQALRANGADSRHVTISNPLGHGAFLRDTPSIAGELARFLAETDPRRPGADAGAASGTGTEAPAARPSAGPARWPEQPPEGVTGTMAIKSEAWVLHRARPGESGPGRLVLEEISFPDLADDQMLVEPLYGCWEGNMTHALLRDPIDVCEMRGEERIVLGNAGTVRVVAVGRAVRDVREGDVAILSAIGSSDEHGFMIHAYAYDAPGTVGLLARRLPLKRENLLYVLRDSQFSSREWAAFSLRFPTAWANWRLAFGAYRLQMTERLCPEPFVVGWGGGVALAELMLARQEGCRVAMIASRPERLGRIRALGIEPIDRREFPDLDFDEARYAADGDYRKLYRRSEEAFLDALRTAGGGRDVAIFLDHVGAPVFRATVKALGRQGVLATAGWRRGMKTSLLRALECINHHVYVHTHGARADEAVEAIEHGEATGWMPALERETCAWGDVGEFAEACAGDRVGSYFPMFAVGAAVEATRRVARGAGGRRASEAAPY